MEIDHVVLWVRDPAVALAFYTDVVGLAPVRAEEFAAGRVGFPSVRLSAGTVLDLMDRATLPRVLRFTGGVEGGGGAPLNHVCLSMAAEEFHALRGRLVERDVPLRASGPAFGARGQAADSVYFRDPDDNVLELRYYDESPGGGE